MFQLSEKTPGETFCEQEEMVLEDKELKLLLEYLRWTFSGSNVDIFKEHLGLILVYQGWFDFGDRQNLCSVYKSLLRANSRLAEMCEWRIKKLRGSDACCHAELTAYYSGIDESNIEKAVEQSNSQPMVWLAQQCITLCDHLVRQAYLLEETKAALEEAKLSDWLKKQSEVRWEPAASSFSSDLPQEARPSPGPLATESRESEEVEVSNVSSLEPQPQESEDGEGYFLFMCVAFIFLFGAGVGISLAPVLDRVNSPEEKAHERQELVSYANNLSLIAERFVRNA